MSKFISNYIEFLKDLHKTNINKEKFQITIKTDNIKNNVSMTLKLDGLMIRYIVAISASLDLIRVESELKNMIVLIPQKSQPQAQLGELDHRPYVNTKDSLFYKETLVKEAEEP